VLPRWIAAKSRSSRDSSSGDDIFSNGAPGRRVGVALDWTSLFEDSLATRRGDCVVSFRGDGLVDVSGSGGMGSGFLERLGDDLE